MGVDATRLEMEMRNAAITALALLMVLGDHLRATTRAVKAVTRIPVPAWAQRFNWSLAARRGTHRAPRPSSFEGDEDDPVRDIFGEYDGADEDWHPMEEIREIGRNTRSQQEETMIEQRDREAAELAAKRKALEEQAATVTTQEIETSRTETDAALARLSAVCEQAMGVIINKWGVTPEEIRADAKRRRAALLESDTAEHGVLATLGDLVRPHTMRGAIAATA